MKITNTTKLLKLKLMQTKIYKKQFIFNKIKLENIEHRLKKSLQIIQKYHFQNKKILFLLPFFLSKWNQFLKNTKHKILNKNIIWVKNKYDLVVIFSNGFDKNFINVNFKKKIPIIFLNSFQNTYNYKLSYRILGNFLFKQKESKKNLFFVLLKSLLTKKICY